MKKSLESARLFCCVLLGIYSFLAVSYSYAQCSNGITSGAFDHLPVGEYSAPDFIGGWQAWSTDKVKVVSQANSNGALIRSRDGDQFSIQQTIYSVKPSFTYEMSFNYGNWTDNCHANARSALQVEVYADGSSTPFYSSDEYQANDAGTMSVGILKFTTPATVSTLRIRFFDPGSPKPACGAVIDNISLVSPLVVSTETLGTTCFGDNTGSMNIEVSGGAAPYSATYTLGESTAVLPLSGGSGSVTGLAPGSYLITITDANSCSITRTVTIAGPDKALTVTATPVMCFGDATGSVLVTASGGTPGYTYTLNGISNSSGSFGNLAAGTYTVFVTDSGGCPTSATFTISQPVSPLTATATGLPASCFGDANGAIQVSVNGGIGPYRYLLNGNSNTTGTFSGLPAGDYAIRVSDANNCVVYVYATVEQPTPVIPSAKINDVACFGGSDGEISLSASGGSGQYVYTMNGSSNSTGIFSNLPAGIYTVRLADVASNCDAELNVTVRQPATQLTAIARPTKCFGEASGSVTVIAAGGTPGYTYTLNGQTNNTGYFDGLGAGSYSISVQDAKGCVVLAEATIQESSTAVSLTASVFNNNCRGASTGSITAVASGGVATYTYTLNGISNTTGIFTGLPAGNYTVFANDANGCPTSIDVTISEPATALLASAVATPATCFEAADGSIQITAQGGTPGYSYNLNNVSNATGSFTGLTAGTYDVTITDAAGCRVVSSVTIEQPAPLIASVQSSWCFGQATAEVTVSAGGGTPGYSYTLNGVTNTSGSFTGVGQGTHTIEVRDATGCVTTIQVSLLTPTSALSLTVTERTDVPCFGESTGRIKLAASGGIAPYRYTLGSSTNGSGVFENLAAGSYSVTVTDANGCQKSAAFQILETSTEIQATVTSTAVRCFGEASGSLQVTASGGAAGYFFTMAGTTNTTGRFTGLTAGTYTVLVTDQKNCTVAVEATVAEPAIKLAVTARIEKCTLANGSIYVTATGGRPGYSYHLGGTTNTTGIFSNIPSGTYQILVSDANNCSASVEVTVSQAASPLSVSVTRQSDASCFQEMSGSVTVRAQGGVPAYTYSLNGISNTTGSFTGLKAGSHLIIVTDRNGCTAQQTVTINQPVAPLTVAALTIAPVTCAGGSTGSIEVEATGGTAPYLFSINGIINTSGKFNNLPAGSYSVLVTDAQGCSAALAATVTQPPAIAASAVSSDVSCFGDSNGTVSARAIGGMGTYSYSLNQVSNTTGVFTGLKAGAYVVHVTDGNGCSAIVQTVVRQPAAALEAAVTPTPASAPGAHTGSAVVAARGGSPAYSYKLAGAVNSTGHFSDLAPGNYVVEVTDARGCVVQVPFVIQTLNLVDLTPALTITSEGKKVTVTAQLREPFGEDVSVTLGYSGSASSKQDYLLTDQFQTIRIPKGMVSTSDKITIHALSDAIPESDEDLQISISATSHPLVIAGEGAVVVIQDIDPDDPMIDRSVPENKDVFPDPLVSPNDDGEGNEFFNIGNILSFPENEVIIYNRWGNVVFKVSGYNATDKVFKGFGNAGLFASAAQPLVDGVYYYVIYTYKMVDSVKERRLNKGYLILKR